MIDFIGIGAQKSGTSWVYACLYEHPEICAPIKEIHFFSRPRFQDGKDWYESHFKNCDPKKLSGEFSTSYLFSEEAPERIYSMYPEVKLIAILRNPIKRAISHYGNAIKAGEIKDTVSFQEFSTNEPSVLKQGLYSEQLTRYYELFSHDQLLVLIYEDIKHDPQAFMSQIYRFLGVSDTFVPSMLYTEINVARNPKSVIIDLWMHQVAEGLRAIGFDRLVHKIRQSGLPDLVRLGNSKESRKVEIDTKSLERYFFNDVKKLSELLGRDLNQEWNIR
jgi:hypothetical protein